MNEKLKEIEKLFNENLKSMNDLAEKIQKVMNERSEQLNGIEFKSSLKWVDVDAQKETETRFTDTPEFKEWLKRNPFFAMKPVRFCNYSKKVSELEAIIKSCHDEKQVMLVEIEILRLKNVELQSTLKEENIKFYKDKELQNEKTKYNGLKAQYDKMINYNIDLLSHNEILQLMINNLKNNLSKSLVENEKVIKKQLEKKWWQF